MPRLMANAVRLKSMPYHNSQRLVIVSGANQNTERGTIFPAEAQDFAAKLATLEDFAAM